MKVLVLGSTGMVGEGVLHQCVLNPSVDSITLINRKPLGWEHKKITEIIHSDLSDLSKIKSNLKNIDACFFCIGVTSLGKSEAKYKHITYDLTMAIAKTLAELNSNMVFCYITGQGADSSEKGKIMWARIKGKTENDLLKMAFKKAYMFRPGFIQPIKGLKNAHAFYFFLKPFFPLLKSFFPGFVCTLEDVGAAMIRCATKGYEKNILENKDITLFAHRS